MPSACGLWPQHGAQSLQLVVAAVAHVGLGGGMGDQLGALPLEVAVAQPAVVLTADVDDPAHRLSRDAPDRLADLARPLERGTAVDQQRARRPDHQAQVGIQPLVGGRACARLADEGVDAVGDALEAHLDRVHCGGAEHRQPEQRLR